MATVSEMFVKACETGFQLSWSLNRPSHPEIVPCTSSPNHCIGWVTDVEDFTDVYKAKNRAVCQLIVQQLKGGEMPCAVHGIKATSLLFQRFSPVRIGVFLSRERNTQAKWTIQSAVVFVDAAAVEKTMRAKKTVMNVLFASTLFNFFTSQNVFSFEQHNFWKKQPYTVQATNVPGDKRFCKRFLAGNKVSFSACGNVIRLTKHVAVDVDKNAAHLYYKHGLTFTGHLRVGVVANATKSFDLQGFLALLLKASSEIGVESELGGACTTSLLVVPSLGVDALVHVLGATTDESRKRNVLVIKKADEFFTTTAESLRDADVVITTYEFLSSRQYGNFARLALTAAANAQTHNNRINKLHWLSQMVMETTGPEMAAAMRRQNILSQEWGSAQILASIRQLFLPSNAAHASLCVPLEFVKFGAVLLLDAQHCISQTNYKDLTNAIGNLEGVHKWATIAGDTLQSEATKTFLWRALLQQRDVPRTQACAVLGQICYRASVEDVREESVTVVKDLTSVPVWDVLDWEDFNVTSDVAKTYYLKADVPGNVCIGSVDTLVERAVFENELKMIRKCFAFAAKTNNNRHASLRLGSGQTMRIVRWNRSVGPVYSSPATDTDASASFDWMVSLLEGARTDSSADASPMGVHANNEVEFFMNFDDADTDESVDSDDDSDEIAQDAGDTSSGVVPFADFVSDEPARNDSEDSKASDNDDGTDNQCRVGLPEHARSRHIRQQTMAAQRHKDAWRGMILDRSTCPVCASDPCVAMLKCGHLFCYACASTSAAMRNSCPTCQTKVLTVPLVYMLERQVLVDAPRWMADDARTAELWNDKVCGPPTMPGHWTAGQFWLWYHLKTNDDDSDLPPCIVVVNTDRDAMTLAKLSRDMAIELARPLRRLTPFSLKQFQDGNTHIIMSKRTLMSGICPMTKLVLVLSTLTDVETSVLKAAVPGAIVRYCVYTLDASDPGVY